VVAAVGKFGYGFMNNKSKLPLQFLYSLNNPELSGEKLTEEQILSNKEIWDNLPQNLKDLVEIDVADGTPSGNWENYPDLKYDDYTSLRQVPGYGQYLADRGKPGVLHSGNVGKLGNRFVKYTGELDAEGKKIKETDRYGNTLYGYMEYQGGRDPEWQRGGYPSYEAWQAAQGGGGGGGATAATTTTPSAFQASGTADTPNYYVGMNPLASNIAWGKQAGVDPRTMGIYNQDQFGFPTWAAEGGRIPAAYGGIMDSETGRRAYGLGSIFKSIKRAAKKVIKSPLGRAALIGGAGWLLGGGGVGAWQGWGGGWGQSPVAGWFGKEGALGGLLRKNIAAKGMPAEWGAISPWKVGIAGLSALPFFMGGGDDDDDDGFDYDATRDKYAAELMRIKAGAMAGTLDPTKFRYQGIKEGGRIGFDDGGFTMDDSLANEDKRVRESYKAYESSIVNPPSSNPILPPSLIP